MSNNTSITVISLCTHVPHEYTNTEVLFAVTDTAPIIAFLARVESFVQNNYEDFTLSFWNAKHSNDFSVENFMEYMDVEFDFEEGDRKLMEDLKVMDGMEYHAKFRYRFDDTSVNYHFDEVPLVR